MKKIRIKAKNHDEERPFTLCLKLGRYDINRDKLSIEEWVDKMAELRKKHPYMTVHIEAEPSKNN